MSRHLWTSCCAIVIHAPEACRVTRPCQTDHLPCLQCRASHSQSKSPYSSSSRQPLLPSLGHLVTRSCSFTDRGDDSNSPLLDLDSPSSGHDCQKVHAALTGRQFPPWQPRNCLSAPGAPPDNLLRQPPPRLAPVHPVAPEIGLLELPPELGGLPGPALPCPALPAVERRANQWSQDSGRSSIINQPWRFATTAKRSLTHRLFAGSARQRGWQSNAANSIVSARIDVHVLIVTQAAPARVGTCQTRRRKGQPQTNQHSVSRTGFSVHANAQVQL